MNEPENGFHAPLPQELAPLFPNYQIHSLIAMGGMGAVYHAVQTSLEREVAIKILPAEFGKDPDFCQSFGAEAKAMAKLNHPNLISVYDFGEVNGMLYIVMEYVPGHSLHEACNGAAVDPAEVVRLMTGVSLGLAHAHGHGILHRDIKPANILLDSHLQPKIGDFGLARPLDAQVQEGEAIFGTPGYTAPEVLEPPHAVDQRADIFSLGVLLHELLTGLLPGTDPRPASAISLCDPRFDAVIHKATHPDPLQRFQSAAEIANALGKIACTPGPRVLKTASPAGSRSRVVRRSSSQLPKKGSGGVLSTLVVIAVIAALIIFKDRIVNMASSGPEPAPVVDAQPDPVSPSPVPPDPEPVNPEPAPESTQPEVAISQPDPVKPEPDPVQPEPDPVVSNPETPEPGTDPADPDVSQGPQPKLNVPGYLAHARNIMVDRCGPIITKRDEELDTNLDNFRNDALDLIHANLEEVYHRGGENELDAYVDTCRDNGNRMEEQLEKPLKFKKWLVELHDQYKVREEKIDGRMKSGFVEHQRTYLYGLGLKLKALEEGDDPGASELIKAEIEKVNASPDYFADLMIEAASK